MKILMVIMPSYFYEENEDKNWKSLMKKAILVFIANMWPVYVPFTYLSTGLGSGLRKYVWVKPKWI